MHPVGADDSVGPPGNHRIRRRVSCFGGAFCRADVGIGPYPFPEKRIKNLKNQTADQSCGLGFLQRQEPLCAERHADARAFLRRFAGRQRHALLLAA